MLLVNGWIYGFLEVELTKSKTVNILSSHIVFCFIKNSIFGGIASLTSRNNFPLTNFAY